MGRRTQMKTRTLAFVTLAALFGCSHSNTASRTTQEQACLDTADAVAKAAQRCGGDYQANFDAFVKNAALGNCANVIQVRDEAALRQTCIPSFTTIQCPALTAGTLDPTCKSQLVHKNFEGELVSASVAMPTL